MTHRKIALPIIDMQCDTSLTEVIEKKKMRIRIGNRYYNL